MKVLIVEEALEELHGHWFQYIRDMADGGRRAGHKVDVLTHKDAVPEVRAVFGDNNVLSRSVYNRPKKDFGWRRLRSIWAHNRSLYADVRKWVETQDKHYDVTILPSMRVDHVLAAHWLKKDDRDGRLGTLVAIFADTVGEYTAPDTLVFPRGTLILKWAMRWCGCAPKRKRIVFATESRGLIEQYRKLCGLPLQYVPHVTVLPSSLLARSTAEGEKLALGTFGFTRYDKGPDVLHDALSMEPPENFSGLRFLLQWTGDYLLPDGRLIEKQCHLCERFNLRYLDKFKTSEEYHHWLSKIDAILLPYRESFYKDKLSRVAIDAALVGLPIIFPRRTWLESFSQEYGSGVPFEPDDASSLRDAIFTLRHKFRELQAIAQERREKTSRDFSGEAFFKTVEGFLDDS